MQETSKALVIAPGWISNVPRSNCCIDAFVEADVCRVANPTVIFAYDVSFVCSKRPQGIASRVLAAPADAIAACFACSGSTAALLGAPPDAGALHVRLRLRRRRLDEA